ncbi:MULTISPECIES: helix-turn-helix domain-containing protein [unclassified Duganella]|uniref:winged helix-turn-helix transcriptional regulator n=1 Tax=unclassified Duganella TaxID=2636909 RepID=UPI000886A338|nr:MULTISPECIES: helix-turn-helix domain-containing protein [unclassified Duganella]SDF97207.1 transcriptional regulator, HxlR family [Duganella sp. OV458]SDJ07471.1 transcriptional regulator, HxlR family [Duganella sp. OV510]
MNCSIAKSLDQVGDAWTLLIVRECTMGKTRFDEFQHGLGIARNILTNRLNQLVADGILETFPAPDRVNTNGYRLTRKGEELYPVLVALMQWGDRWRTAHGKPLLTLADKRTGQAVQPVDIRSADGALLSYRDIRLLPGPGATDSTLAVIDSRNQRVLGEE